MCTVWKGKTDGEILTLLTAHEIASLSKRLWRMVDVSPGHGPYNNCWVWKASVSGNKKNPYGNFTIKHQVYKAHRIVYQLKHGILPKGIQVLHKCDLGVCVRPDHLFVGNQSDNMLDMHKKNRHQLPEDFVGPGTISHQIAEQIRLDYATGKYTQRQLCTKYNFKSQGSMSLLLNFRRW
jgi:hypothetical protein